VRASVLDGRAAGLDVFVLTDGIAGIDPASTQSALEEMERAGARLVSTAALDAPGVGK
jgi:nicotinamidase/pyrazinamidase